MIAVGVTSGFLNQYQLIMNTLQGTSANGPIRWPDEKLGTLVEQLPVSIGPNDGFRSACVVATTTIE
jgi:hypothetical protein